MDENVERIRKLLESGYKIIHIEWKLDQIKAPGVMEHKVTLKKGESRELVESSGSEEFFKYIIHFKQAKDKYDNSEFIYVRDLARYNEIVKSAQNHTVLQDHHKLKISGREFAQGITTMSLNPPGPANKVGTAQIWVDLDRNPDFVKVDFKDEIEVRDRTNTIVLKGHVRNYQSSEKTGFLSIQDLSIRMESEKVTAEFNKMNSFDAARLVAESGGFPFVLHGATSNTSTRPFNVIMPIQNLIIDQSFRIGNVEFYQDFNSLDDALIRKSTFGRSNPLWNGNLPRARTQVMARQFFEAITTGYDAICRAIDVVSFRVDWTFPSVEAGDKRQNLMFSYYKYLSRVKGTTLIYCREVDTQANTFFNIESIIDNILSFEIDPQEYFADANDLCDSILKKDKDGVTKDEGRVLQVLHCLRKSIQEGNKRDKFLDLWVAFEFLTSGTSIPKLFQQSEITALIKMADDLKVTDEQKRALHFRLKQLNEPSQMAIFKHLVKTLGVDFTDAELKLLTTARKKRTEIIHGKKDPEIKDEELNKMRTILGKVLIQKISVLKSSAA